MQILKISRLEIAIVWKCLFWGKTPQLNYTLEWSFLATASTIGQTKKNMNGPVVSKIMRKQCTDNDFW